MTERRLLAALLSASLVLIGLAAPVSAPAQVPGTPELTSATPEGAQPEQAPPQGGQGPAAAAPGPAVEQLSDERTRSRWAYVTRTVTPRVQPSSDAAAVRDSKGRSAVLRPWVKDTFSDELVLALSRTRSADGTVWVEVRLPMRPNNTTGWVPRGALSDFRIVRTRLVVDRGRLRASLYRDDRLIWTARIGVGIAKWPTPAGRFYVRERLRVPRGSAQKVYGPLAIGTSAHSPTLSGGNWGQGVIGVHGTGRPDLLPGRVSHGCVRVSNPKIRRLWKLMPLGTPILIR